MWWDIVLSVWYSVSIEAKIKEKQNRKNLCYLRLDIQIPPWLPLFKLDELLIRLRKVRTKPILRPRAYTTAKSRTTSFGRCISIVLRNFGITQLPRSIQCDCRYNWKIAPTEYAAIVFSSKRNISTISWTPTMNMIFLVIFKSLRLQIFSKILLWQCIWRWCRHSNKLIPMLATTETRKQRNHKMRCMPLDIWFIPTHCKLFNAMWLKIAWNCWFAEEGYELYKGA